MASDEDYSVQQREAFYVTPPGWCAVCFRGMDRGEWLHGQTTQDVLGTEIGQSCLVAFASMTGQCECLGSLLRSDEADYLLTERSAAEVVLKRVDDFVILEDVQATILQELAISHRETSLSWLWPSFTPGLRVIAPLSATEPEVIEGKDEKFPPELLGFPAFEDYYQRILIPELGARFAYQFLDGNKGCYVGQEVIHRVAVRGKVNRAWDILAVEGEWPDLGRHDFGTIMRRFESEQGLVGCAEHTRFASALIKTAFDDQSSFETETGKLTRVIGNRGVPA